MTCGDPIGTWHVQARDPAAALAEAQAARLELGDDEIVQLSLRPSLWFIAIVSARFVAAAALLASLAGLQSGGFTDPLATGAFVVLLAAAAVRIAVAALQWASRVYILTNRRVTCFRGVLTIDVRECLLARIADVRLRRSALQRCLGIGSILMSSHNAACPPVNWNHISRPAEIHEILVRAVRKAQP